MPLRHLLRLLILLTCFPFAHAHDPGLSTADLSLEADRLTVLLTFAPADAQTLARQEGEPAARDFEAILPRLQGLAREALAVRFDGRLLEPEEFMVLPADNENVQVRLSYPRPEASQLGVRFNILSELPLGHRQYVTLRDRSEDLLGEGLLDAGNNLFEHQLSKPARTPARSHSFGQFLTLGVEHIVTGYDHLLFLLGLLIVGGSFKSSLKIITAFTVAHSITLVLATFRIVELPASVVEPLIAASIVYVAIENLFRPRPESRWRLTFAFGLVHGLGFASILRELGIGSGAEGVILPLLSFNLGVELGQLAIAAVILPLVWKLRTNPTLAVRQAHAISALMAVAGAYWLVERTLL